LISCHGPITNHHSVPLDNSCCSSDDPAVIQPGLMLVVAGGVALYISSRAGADALRSRVGDSPGRMAVGLWMPIGVVALLAMRVNRPEIAIGVIFATSVASLSLVVGAVTFLSPPMIPVMGKGIWPTVVPAGMLAFLAGFRGELNWVHASVLALEGVVVLWVWRGPTALEKSADKTGEKRFWMLRVVQFVLAIGLAGIGAWAGVRGTERTSELSEVASAGLLSATLLSPLLVLPMLGAGIDLAHRGKSATAVTAEIGVVLLNLCLLLPVVVGVGYWRGTAAVPFPLAVWRVDVVAVIALALFLLPVSQGRWRLNKSNGLALILGYVMYLLLATTLGVMMI
jgi:Ca2+/Na+ antiporter